MKSISLVALLLVQGICYPLLSEQVDPARLPSIAPDNLARLRSGDPGRLTEALQHGLSPNGRDAEGSTPLTLEAMYGDLSCMQILVQSGADVNAANAAGATPLLRAAFDFPKLRFLVEHGANVQARSRLGNTALILAARPPNSHEAVEWLLAKGADAKATNIFGATALMAAAAGGDAQSVRLLLSHGADADAQPMADPNSFVFGGGRSALMWAAYRGDVEIMKTLLDAGADPNREGFLGTPLNQAAWGNRVEAARLLLDRGARVNQLAHGDGYSALHWAASSEQSDPALVNLLLARGADANLGGGEPVDAFVGVEQTPLMLARRRGETPIVAALRTAGATKQTPDRLAAVKPPRRVLPETIDTTVLAAAIRKALPQLEETALESKKAFLSHGSHQDCTSCHQQYLPMAAIGYARHAQVPIDADSERKLIQIVGGFHKRNAGPLAEALFHPEPAQTVGYGLFGWHADDQPADPATDVGVHHLTVIQCLDGHWCNNLPRPPIQSGDITATALAVHALQSFPLPGRKSEFAERIQRAQRWLGKQDPQTTAEQVFQILGLAWAGESKARLEPLSKKLIGAQRPDGGWAELPDLPSDAYATGQVVYALHVAGGLPCSDPALARGRAYLLEQQLEDGTWYVHRRTFPFQPTMNSGFPHGRDSWLSAAATSWAVMALSLPGPTEVAAREP